MKKSLIAATIGLSVLVVSCKKTTQTSLSPKDMTGPTTISGNVQKNQASGTAPAVGVTVSIEIKNSALYPNSPTAQGSTIYSGVTDASGNYSISVTTIGGNGIFAPVTIGSQTSTYDPVTGSQAIFNGVSVNITLISGVPATYNYTMPVSTFVGTTTTGTATVLGKLFIQYWIEGPATVFNLGNVKLANQNVMIDFNKDPTTQAVKTYTVTTDANGAFQFDIASTSAAGFTDQGKIYINDFYHTQDTIHLGNVQVAGLPGYYSGFGYFINGLTPGTFNNGNYMTYSSFNQN